MTRAEAERREQIAMAICGAAVLHCIPCICKRDGRSPASCTAPACNDALRAADAVLALPDTGEADGWREINSAPKELQERAAYMRGEAGAYRNRLCQYFDFGEMTNYCWVVRLGPAAGDGVTHYFAPPIPEMQEKADAG